MTIQFMNQKIGEIEGVITKNFEYDFWVDAIENIKDKKNSDAITILFTQENQPIGLSFILFHDEDTMIDCFEIAEKFKDKGHGTAIVKLIKDIFSDTDVQGYAVAESARFWARNSSNYDRSIFKELESQHKEDGLNDSELFEGDGQLMWFQL